MTDRVASCVVELYLHLALPIEEIKTALVWYTTYNIHSELSVEDDFVHMLILISKRFLSNVSDVFYIIFGVRESIVRVLSCFLKAICISLFLSSVVSSSQLFVRDIA
jgi:hypothetical protein